MTNPVQQLMAKEMDRKQFLLHAGAVIFTLVGVSGLIKALTEPSTGSSGGYGSSPYGGRTEGRR